MYGLYIALVYTQSFVKVKENVALYNRSDGDSVGGPSLFLLPLPFAVENEDGDYFSISWAEDSGTSQ